MPSFITPQDREKSSHGQKTAVSDTPSAQGLGGTRDVKQVTSAQSLMTEEEYDIDPRLTHKEREFVIKVINFVAPSPQTAAATHRSLVHSMTM